MSELQALNRFLQHPAGQAYVQGLKDRLLHQKVQDIQVTFGEDQILVLQDLGTHTVELAVPGIDSNWEALEKEDLSPICAPLMVEKRHDMGEPGAKEEPPKNEAERS